MTNISAKNKKVIYHFYGVSADFFSMASDEQYLQINSPKNHFWNYALQKLNQTGLYRCEVHLFTQKRQYMVFDQDDLKFYFHPLVFLAKTGFLKRFFNKQSNHFVMYLIKNKPDVFVFYCGVTLSLFPIISLVWLMNIPYVIQYHGSAMSRFAFFKKIIYKKARLIIVPTEQDKTELASAYKLNSNKIEIIPCGINTDFFKPNNKNSETYPTLCVSGILSERKSFKETLRCFAKVRDIFPNARLEVAGEYETIKYKTECDELIRKLNLERSISFHGWVNKDYLKQIYSRSDLLMFPSKNEPLGRSLLEAMACGTPVVGLKQAKGPREIIQDRTNGVLTTLENLDNDVLNVIREKMDLHLMSAKCRDIVIKNYSFDSLYQKAESAYTRAANE